MARDRNRRSWQMLAPHMGELFGRQCSFRNPSVVRSASSVLIRLSRTSANRPDAVWVRVFQSSISYITDRG